MLDQKDIERLEGKLDAIIRLLAAPQVEGKKLSEGAVYLDRLGVDRDTIAGLYATTPDAVRVSLRRSKQAEAKAGKES
jgi:hypothetical protein